MSITSFASDLDLFGNLEVQEVNDDLQENESDSELVFIPPEDEENHDATFRDTLFESQLPMFDHTDYSFSQVNNQISEQKTKNNPINKAEQRKRVTFREDELEMTSNEGSPEELLHIMDNDEFMSMSQETVPACVEESVQEHISTSIVTHNNEIIEEIQIDSETLTSNKSVDLEDTIVASLSNNCDISDDDSFEKYDFSHIDASLSGYVSSISQSNASSSNLPNPMKEYFHISQPKSIQEDICEVSETSNKKLIITKYASADESQGTSNSDKKDPSTMTDINKKTQLSSTKNDSTEEVEEDKLSSKNVTPNLDESDINTQDYDFFELIQNNKHERNDLLSSVFPQETGIQK